MKVLMWHCKKFRISNIKHSTRMNIIDNQINEIDEMDEMDEMDVIVPCITIESAEDSLFLEDLIEEIAEMSAIHQTKKIIVAPFGHLSHLCCARKKAYHILQTLVTMLKEKGFVTKLVHFGSHKDTEFLSESHPEQVRFRTYPKPVWKLS